MPEPWRKAKVAATNESAENRHHHTTSNEGKSTYCSLLIAQNPGVCYDHRCGEAAAHQHLSPGPRFLRGHAVQKKRRQSRAAKFGRADAAKKGFDDDGGVENKSSTSLLPARRARRRVSDRLLA